MNAQDREKAILKNMKYLKMTRQEAEETVAIEERIDKGEIPVWAVETKEEKANRRKLMQASSLDKTKKEKKPREKKIDNVKQNLIAMLHNAILDYGGENAEITNIDRVVAFELGGEKYEITLTKKRKAKGE